MRFLVAAAVLIAVLALLRRPLPRGRALVGVIVYGVLTFGSSNAFVYQALTEVTVGTAVVVLSLVPLLTLLLSVAQGVERFRVQGLIGAAIAAGESRLSTRDRSARCRCGRW